MTWGWRRRELVLGRTKILHLDCYILRIGNIHRNKLSRMDFMTENSEQFSIIRKLFPLKDEQFLRYEFVSIFGSEKIDQAWSPEQIALLNNIMEEQQFKGQWKRISYEMFIQSKGKYFKSRQSCRNRWYNHVDPNINKKQWTPEEDYKMIQYIMINGARWSLIARTICKGRNEHMIKNRYRSLVRKFRISSKFSIQKACQEILQYLRVVRLENQGNSSGNNAKIQYESLSQENSAEEEQLKEQDYNYQRNHEGSFSSYPSASAESSLSKISLGTDQIFAVHPQREKLAQQFSLLNASWSILQRTNRIVETQHNNVH